MSTDQDSSSSGDEATEFKSRNYQDEILKSCIEKNTIIYLPTGAGKTYIAIMALKHFAKDLEKSIMEGGKRSVFLTNTVALAHQQAEVIEKSTSLKVAVYTGDMNVDAWGREKWFTEFDDNQVVCATVQIILDIVRHGYLKISNFNLMVFDECHHAQKEHPMLMLMAKFNDCKESDHPRVIGLTGMLTAPSIKPQNVIDDLRRLEATFRATITTAKGTAFNDVLMYSTKPEESIIMYDTNVGSSFQEFVARKVNKMREMIAGWPLDDTHEIVKRMEKQVKPQTKYETICKEFIFQMGNLGLYGGMLSNLAAIVDMELKKREANTSATKWISRTLITYFEEILHLHMRKVYDDEDDENEMETDEEMDEQALKEDPSTILTNSSSQVQKLLIFLKQHAEKNPNRPMKGLIFVQRRYTARILCHVIRRYVNAYPHLKIHVDFMTGRNAYMPDSVETLINNKNNSRVLDKFRRGDINLIVATSVLEEGIDLQECNMVLCYDKPTTFRSYVQTKGRARMTDSVYVRMTSAAETNKLQKQTAEWNEINRILRTYLVEKAIDRTLPDQDDIDKAIEQKYNEKFATSKGAVVDYFSAIALINRYCASLPCDIFTKPAIQWSLVPDQNFTVKIALPIQSSLKEEIQGKRLPSLKLAQRSAAFEAIKKLYNCRELSENLLPINKQKCLENFKSIYFKSWEQFESENPKTAGTKKNYRMHDLVVPDALCNSMPQIGVPVFLYEIKMVPKFHVSDSLYDQNEENVKIFHNLLQSPRTYGILTTKKLPRMSEMKFYQSFGQINCTISYQPIQLQLGNLEKLNELKRFHCILFRNVLDVWKSFFTYDHKDSVIVVPTKNHQIDWQIVEQFQSWSELKQKSIGERKNAKYIEDEWLYSVVCPWYRADQSVRYVVTKVNTFETPLSPFPNDQFPSYQDYVQNKYPDISEVVNKKQFLIGVEPMTRRLNRLHPGEGEDGKRSNRTKPRGPEYLIPELCHNFHYPGDLWLKAIVLPSVMHRITYILHAEKIRMKINHYLGMNIVNYIPNELTSEMARNKLGFAKVSTQNSIVQPRVSESEAKVLRASEIQKFDASAACLGPEMKEPIDLERHFDEAYEVDIDYYFQFINRSMNNLQLNDNTNRENSILSPNQFQSNVPALCDVSKDDKLHINLLDVKLSTHVARGVEQNDILSAITAASSSDVFHMELFEVLGDAFLKFGASLYLIQKHTEWHEGFLTAIKGQIVGNRNLCYSAIRHNISGIIKVLNFNPKDDWQPPMLKVADVIQGYMKEFDVTPTLLYQLALSTQELEAGELSMENLTEFIQKFANEANIGGGESTMQNFLGKQRMSDKTCADCIEAILGACVKSIGVERSFKVLEMFDILPCNGMDITRMLHNELRSPRIRTNISDHDVDYFLANHKKLEQSIGYTFKDRAYLLQALTHPSYPTNRVTGCYQQLEFLGDAVLDFLITAYIFERCPQMDPGQLTDLRSALVNNVTLACLCVRYNIHGHILSQSAVLTESISRFVDFQRNHNHEVTDHVELLMEEKEVRAMDEKELDCKMADYVDVPKTLGDVFEALIGGIFLDSGNDLEVTWKVIYRLMEKELNKFMANVPIQVVRQLYEYPNANPEFDDPVVNEELDIVLVSLRFTCRGNILLVHGFGANKENAKRAAAKLALSKLKVS